METCIWCKERNQDTDIEHIIPEALGCPEGFHLDGGLVCRKCNNKLGFLDRMVISEFEIPAFLANVPRKKNKPPSINSFGNVKSHTDQNERALLLNMSKEDYKFPTGETVPPFRGRNRDIKASFSNVGLDTHVSFEFEIGKSKRFRRGIIKIAFSILAKAFGSEECCQQKYDHIRKFVVEGENEIPMLLMHNKTDGYSTRSFNPYISESGTYVVCLRICHIDFAVDFSEDFRSFLQIRKMMKSTHGNHGYTWLPIDF